MLSAPLSLRCSSAGALQQTRARTFGHAARVTRGAAVRTSARVCRPTALVVEANELNKWGDTDGRENDTDPGELDDGFETDTANVLLRVLTARATQKLLMQLQELDLHVASWLSDFCSQHSPTKGDEFLLELMKQGGVDITEATNNTTHGVSPADLVERILLVRADMAKRISATFPTHVELQSRQLKVKHLSKSYVSGTTSSSRRRR